MLTLHLEFPIARAALQMVCALPGHPTVANRAVWRVGRVKAKNLVCLADTVASFAVVIAAVAHEEALAKFLARWAALCRASFSRGRAVDFDTLELGEHGVCECEALIKTAARGIVDARILVGAVAVLHNLAIRLLRYGNALRSDGQIIQHECRSQGVHRRPSHVRTVEGAEAALPDVLGELIWAQVERDGDKLAVRLHDFRRNNAEHSW
mmetsp:Transcript_37364/g.86241  ORF Transcript_37364/g.86241 Transcript_37364/m.86241 type:complete len:209 (-) Transcript_37364:829-1455(-)